MESPLSIEESIHDLLINQHLTLSLAESCTGGALSARLTRIPGCSQYFLGSCVTYSNELKIKLLGVKPQDLEKYGAVSREVVEQMVLGVQELTNSDYSLAVSGIAGPSGGTLSKPVGTIWGAILKKGGTPYVLNAHFSGDRQHIINQAVNLLLYHLWRLIKNGQEDIA